MVDLCREVPKGASQESLELCEDITRNFLKSSSKEEEKTATCKTSLQKAAVVSFQTWNDRLPGIVGVCLVEAKSKRWVCPNIVVAKSFDELLQSEKLKKYCSDTGLK